VDGLKQTNADVTGVRADVSLKAELRAAADDQGAEIEHPPQQALADSHRPAACYPPVFAPVR
jgi:hypothetical protein